MFLLFYLSLVLLSIFYEPIKQSSEQGRLVNHHKCCLPSCLKVIQGEKQRTTIYNSDTPICSLNQTQTQSSAERRQIQDTLGILSWLIHSASETFASSRINLLAILKSDAEMAIAASCRVSAATRKLFGEREHRYPYPL